MRIQKASMTATKSKLILRDSVTFLILSFATVVLFAATLLLFRSFEQHRRVLNERWAQRGRGALQHGEPAEAVADLRTALSYDPNQRDDQLLLAQALAADGHIEEATNYFLNLRESQPGDGLINLDLARLARRQGDAQEAVEYYRAAIFGNWQGDGVSRRRETRLERVDYLAERGERESAKAELLIAVGNAPEDSTTDVMFGDRFSAIGDEDDGLQFYEKALKLDPRDTKLLVKAGRLAYASGKYRDANTYLTRVLESFDRADLSESERASIVTLAENARRSLDLQLSRDLPSVERADHIVLASKIAQARLRSCMSQLGALSPDTSAPAQVHQGADRPLQDVQARWRIASKQLTRRTLERDAALQDQLVQLIGDTEIQTSSACGRPTGDDALLLSSLSPSSGHGK